MSTMVMELMQHLQDVHTHHPNDDGRVIVTVPTTPHAVEQFEVGVVHHDGPSVVLHCQPLEDEQARPQDEQARPQDEQATPPARKTQRPDTQLRILAFWPGIFALGIFAFLDVFRVMVSRDRAGQVEKTRTCVHHDYEDLL
ncbi:MAG: hypothetical protein JO114_15775 [Planctomycetaceae bacterium]|nr:hypothetical protein [Planctomycetaceae bacterium]